MCDSSRGLRSRTCLPTHAYEPADADPAADYGGGFAATRPPRWTAITDSSFPHERAALERIRAAMPDTDPWRAWSNFSFATATGRLYEVDLLIAAPSGLHMVELKAWNGEVAATKAGWVQTNAAGRRVEHGRPIRLAFHKSEALARLLDAAGEHVFIRSLIGLSDERLRTYLSGPDMRYVVSIESLVPQLSRQAHEARNRMTPERVARIGLALEFAGITASDTPPHPVNGPNR